MAAEREGGPSFDYRAIRVMLGLEPDAKGLGDYLNIPEKLRLANILRREGGDEYFSEEDAEKLGMKIVPNNTDGQDS